MATTSEFTTIAVADIIDQLVEAVDAARTKAAGNQRWLGAVDRAWDYLLQVDAVSYDHADHALRVESASEPGKVYIANGACGCKAFAEHGNACWHRAAARLVRRAVELRTSLELNALAAELVVEAREAGLRWYGIREGLEGARDRMADVERYAAEWDEHAMMVRDAVSAARYALAA